MTCRTFLQVPCKYLYAIHKYGISSEWKKIKIFKLPKSLKKIVEFFSVLLEIDYKYIFLFTNKCNFVAIAKILFFVLC